MGDQNTRPQPSDEPGAYLKEWSAEGCPCKRVDLHPYLELWLQNLKPVVTPLYPARALEAARREDQARIAALEADNARLKRHIESNTKMWNADHAIAQKLIADNARLMGLVKEAEEGFSGPTAWLERWATHVGNCHGGALCECGLTLARFESTATLAKIKEATDDHTT